MKSDWPLVAIRNLVQQVEQSVKPQRATTYRLLGVRWYGLGPFVREEVTTTTSKASRLFPVKPGQFVYNRLFAWKGSFGVISADHKGCHVSGEFPLFEVDTTQILVDYLFLYMNRPTIWESIEIESTGSTSVSRNRWKEERFLGWKIRLPSVPVQRRIVDLVSSVDSYITALQQQADAARVARSAVLSELLSAGGEDWTKSSVRDVLAVSIGGVWGKDPGADEIDVFVYRQTEFGDDGILSTPSEAVRSISTKQLISRVLQPEDVLMQKSAGTPTLPGRVVIVPPEIEVNATCSNFLHLLRSDAGKCDPHFLFWSLWLNHRSGKAFEFQRGTNIRNLDLNEYLAQSIVLPPLTEQKRIVSIMSSINELVQSTEGAVVKVRRLRSALLSDLLSGAHEIPESYDRLLGAA